MDLPDSIDLCASEWDKVRFLFFALCEIPAFWRLARRSVVVWRNDDPTAIPGGRAEMNEIMSRVALRAFPGEREAIEECGRIYMGHR
jgi:ADP-ribose pyrophosphatase YjhB (NUDIX family)